MNAEQDEAAEQAELAETDEDELPPDPDEYTQHPRFGWRREFFSGAAAAETRDVPRAQRCGASGERALQIVADSDDAGRRTEVG
jgi:hypothetical protein